MSSALQEPVFVFESRFNFAVSVVNLNRTCRPIHVHSLPDSKPMLFSPARSYSSFRKPPLSLDQFLLRQRVLSLWREIVRAIHRVPEPTTRKELRQYARRGFEAHRHESDRSQIRFLLSSGKTEFQAMRRYVDEMAAR